MKKTKKISQNNTGFGKKLIEFINTKYNVNQAENLNLLDLHLEKAIHKLSTYNNNTKYLKENLLKIINNNFYYKNKIDNQITFLQNVSEQDLLMCNYCKTLNEIGWEVCENCNEEKDF